MYKSLNRYFKLYIWLLPLQLFSFFRSFKNMFSTAAAIENDFFLLVFGMMLIVFMSGGKIRYERGHLITDGVRLVLSLAVISLITSLILFIPFGTLYGENTLTASFASQIYLLLTGAAFYFNYILFRSLPKTDITRVLDGMCVLFLILGAVQIAIISGVPGVGRIYDRLDIFEILRDTSYLTGIHRICLTASEPSGMGDLVGVLMLPYVLSQLLFAEGSRKKYVFFAAALFVISFFSLSSTVYFCVVIDLIVFCFLGLKGRKRLWFLLLVVIALAACLILWNSVIKDSYVGEAISYLLFEKTTSTSNMSSAYRYSTVVNDLNCFIRYPISGVGNGNQGFLYNESMQLSIVPEEMRSNPGTVQAMSGSMGVVAGGAFTPSFLSGYGLIGVVLLIIFLKKGAKRMRLYADSMGCFRNMYIIGGITFLAVSTVSGGLDGNFLAIFVCSLPFMARESASN